MCQEVTGMFNDLEYLAGHYVTKYYQNDCGVNLGWDLDTMWMYYFHNNFVYYVKTFVLHLFILVCVTKLLTVTQVYYCVTQFESVAWACRHVWFILYVLPRASPRLLCMATQQKNGHGSEEEAEKPEPSSSEKALMEEKSQLEEQLKDMTVSEAHLPQVSCGHLI